MEEVSEALTRISTPPLQPRSYVVCLMLGISDALHQSTVAGAEVTQSQPKEMSMERLTKMVKKLCLGDMGYTETGRDGSVVSEATNTRVWDLRAAIRTTYKGKRREAAGGAVVRGKPRTTSTSSSSDNHRQTSQRDRALPGVGRCVRCQGSNSANLLPTPQPRANAVPYPILRSLDQHCHQQRRSQLNERHA